MSQVESDEWIGDIDMRPLPLAPMSEAEFLEWVTEYSAAEWVRGRVHRLSPSTLIHCEIRSWLVGLMYIFAERKAGGKVLGRPFTARFSSVPSRRLPDVQYIARDRLTIVHEYETDGPPDLIAEIVEADSQSRDRRDKYLEYEKAGVREYWIVDPLSQTVEAYTLGPTQTYTLIPEADGQIPSNILPGFHLKPAWLWQEKLPDAIEILRGMGIEF